MQAPPNAPTPNLNAPAQSSKTPIVVIIIAVVGVLGLLVVAGIGIMSSLSIYGVRKYLSEAKHSEGKNGVGMIARSAIASAERETLTGGHELPPTAAPVPSTLAQVSKKKYMSSPSDWSGPGWADMKFSLHEPQYFLYRWEKTSPTEGVASTTCDLDGDGVADVKYELAVTCTTSPTWSCSSSPTIKETH